VLAMSSGSSKAVGKAAQASYNWHGSFVAFCGVLRPSELMDYKYFGAFFKTKEYRDKISDLAKGTNINNIRREHLHTLRFPLPPLTEQRRIVAAVEEQFSRLDAGVAALERVQTNLKHYRAAVIKAAVEGRLTEAWREENPDVEPASELLERILKERRERWEKDQLPAYEMKGKKPPKNWRSKYKEPAGPNTDNLPELPEGWCWAGTEALSQFVTSGSRGWAKYYSDDGATFIRMGNLDHETVTLDLSHVQRVNPPAGAEGTRTRVQPNDILVSITAELGMIALAPDDLDEAYINQHVALARPVNGRTGKYLAWYLASRNGNRQLQSLRRGATKIGLGLDDIRAVSIALPPLAEQEQIVVEIERRLSILQEVEAEVEANLKRAARLRQAILKRAFEGKLVPQDPSDEPASELLAQIRSDRERRGPAKRRKKKPARDEPAEAQAGLF
jgi:type I restriction enzyme S subunit